MAQVPSNFLGGPAESVGFTAHYFMFSVKVEVRTTLTVRGLLPRDLCLILAFLTSVHSPLPQSLAPSCFSFSNFYACCLHDCPFHSLFMLLQSQWNCHLPLLILNWIFSWALFLVGGIVIHSVSLVKMFTSPWGPRSPATNWFLSMSLSSPISLPCSGHHQISPEHKRYPIINWSCHFQFLPLTPCHTAEKTYYDLSLWYYMCAHKFLRPGND